MIVRALIDAIESIAPRSLAEAWDNTGLLLGSPGDQLAGPVLLTIDLTDPVLDEAAAAGCRAIISYHPPIFDPIKRITDQTRTGRIILRAARMGLVIYSPHTALDATPGGMADWLADGVGAGSREVDRFAIVPHAAVRPGVDVKIVTFVPAEHAGKLRDAMAAAGAGMIGDYTRCSFTVEGTGAFYGGASTTPAVGQAGRLESAQELRLEMVCANGALPAALAALRRVHPYEEPAIDVLPLSQQPTRSVGMGRVLVVEQPVTVADAAARLAKLVGPSATLQTSGDPARKVSRIGLCPGAGGSLADAARSAGCELLVTGEMKHHEVLAAGGLGLSVLLAGHTHTERGYLPSFRERITNVLPGVTLLISKSDAPPLRRVG